MIKIDISINQIILHLFELVLIGKKESVHQIDHIKTIHLVQKSFLLLTVSHSKDEHEFVDKIYLQITYFFPMYQLNIGVMKLLR